MEASQREQENIKSSHEWETAELTSEIDDLKSQLEQATQATEVWWKNIFLCLTYSDFLNQIFYFLILQNAKSSQEQIHQLKREIETLKSEKEIAENTVVEMRTQHEELTLNLRDTTTKNEVFLYIFNNF